MGSTPSTTEIQTSENSNNPTKKEKSGKTMTLRGRVAKRQQMLKVLKRIKIPKNKIQKRGYKN